MTYTPTRVSGNFVTGRESLFDGVYPRGFRVLPLVLRETSGLRLWSMTECRDWIGWDEGPFTLRFFKLIFLLILMKTYEGVSPVRPMCTNSRRRNTSTMVLNSTEIGDVRLVSRQPVPS